MQVAAQEAMGAQQAKVAKEALLQLYNLVETDSAGAFQPGDEAVILSNVVRIIQDSASQTGEGKTWFFF